MATYKEIVDDVRRHHGCSVKTCWGAHVKRLNGLPVRAAHNRIDVAKIANPCPAWARPLIGGSMRRLGML